MSSDDAVITVEHVTKRFRIVRGADAPTNLREAIVERVRRPLASSLGQGEFVALDDVSFSVGRGEIFGVIGANGAGKSTLLKVITRVTTIDRGRIAISGRVGSLLEVGTGFHPDLTGRENVYLNGMILGMGHRAVRRRFDEIVDFAGVEEFIDTPVKRFSSGMQVRLAFSVAAHLDAEILLVDEVLGVGDNAFQRRCVDKIEEIARSQGRTTLFVTHNMAPIRAMCSRALLLAGGRVAYVGDVGAAVEAYLQGSVSGDEAGVWDLSLREGATFLRSLRLLDGDGRPAPVVVMGGRLTVQVGFDDLGGIRRPGLGVRITDEAGAPLATFVAPVDGMATGNGGASVELAIPALPLTPGRYGVDLWIVATEEWTLCDIATRAGTFRVESPEVNGEAYKALHGDGAVAIEARWSVPQHSELRQG